MEFILSNNGTAIIVNDGINLPSGETYTTNYVNILSPLASQHLQEHQLIKLEALTM